MTAPAFGSSSPGEVAASKRQRERGGPVPWWTQPFRTFQTNLREIDAGLDVEAVLDRIQEHGADTWLLSVGGIVSGYPSRLPSQAANPHLAERPSGDLVGDAVAAAEARGVRVLARMDFSKIDAERAERNPQWCYVSPDGEPQIYNGFRSVCPSGEYYQREMFSVVAEVLQNYPISGFLFNWMSFNEVDYSRQYWGVCHCEACLRGFDRFAPGTPLPKGPEDPSYARWAAFSSEVLADLDARIRTHVTSLAPEVALVQGASADITFHEANNAVGRTLWHRATGDAVDAARSIDPRRPVFVNAVAFVDMPYRWAGEDARHMEQYLLQAIAHGAQPSTYVMGTPADSPFDAVDAAGEVTRFHRDHEEIYRGLRSAARTGLVRPAMSGGAAPAAHSLSEYEGWHQALSEAHAPFAVLVPESLSRGGLRERFDLLILPDLEALAPSAVRTMDRFLADGGRIVTTGSTAWESGAFQLRTASPIAEQRAVLGSEESVRSLHLNLADEGLGEDISSPRHVPVVGGFRVLAAAPGADSAWPALGRSLYGPPEKCFGNEPVGHPGMIRDVGPGGGVLTVLPWMPGLVHREIGLQIVADAMITGGVGPEGTLLRWGGTLPAEIEIVPGRTREAMIVHLLNRSGEREQRFVRPQVTRPGTLDVPVDREPTAVRAHVAGRDLTWNFSGGRLHVDVPALELFEVLEIRGV